MVRAYFIREFGIMARQNRLLVHVVASRMGASLLSDIMMYQNSFAINLREEDGEAS